ncbi:MAG: leucine-rich repeat protein, partial [Clostridia bacterium]|nr:leucine-rich repeat protein [Clostridia bacterium]
AVVEEKTATCTVTVTLPADSISLSEKKLLLLAGNEETLTYSIRPENSTSKVVWSVEPEGIASVNDGTVTALAQGEAVVRATVDGHSSSCWVRVTEDGFNYQLSEDGQSYSVEQNYHSMVDLTEAEIASEYNGKPVTTIGRWALSGLDDTLQKLKIPASVTAIDLNSIDYCRMLESIEVDENNPEYATVGGILYNKAVTESIYTPRGITGVVTIPESMTKISDYMFNNCAKITGVKMHDGVTAIGKGAFGNCTGLHSITIPQNVTEIGERAFSGCTKLWEIYNLSGLKIELGGDAWTATHGQIGLYALNILYSKNDPSGIHKTDDGFTFYTARDEVYLVDYTGDETELVLPQNYNDSAYKIHNYTFYDCDFLTSVTIPNGVTSIGYYAFFGCRGLTNIKFEGTKEEWKAIEKDSYWNSSTDDFTIQCTDGKLDKNGKEIA